MRCRLGRWLARQYIEHQRISILPTTQAGRLEQGHSIAGVIDSRCTARQRLAGGVEDDRGGARGGGQARAGGPGGG